MFPNTDQFLVESGLEHPESFLIRMPIGEDSPLKPMLLAIWNRLHPADGKRQSKVVYDTVKLAELLNIHIVVLMSCDNPQDRRSVTNWITCAWRQSIGTILIREQSMSESGRESRDAPQGGLSAAVGTE